LAGGELSNHQIQDYQLGRSAMDALGGGLWESVPVSAAASRDVSRSGRGGVVGLTLPSVFRQIKANQGKSRQIKANQGKSRLAGRELSN
jgi:hypothetical protein